MNSRMKTRLRICALGSAAVVTSSVAAQDSGIPVQQFQPAPGGAQNYNHVQGAGTLGSLQPAFGLFLNYGYRPLEISSADGDSADLLHQQLQADFLGAVGLGTRFQVGLAFPLTLFQNAGTSDVFDVPPVAAQTPGDVRFIPKWRVLGGDTGTGLALEGIITVPTGSVPNLQGNLIGTLEPKAILEFGRGGRLRGALNLGYQIRKDQAIYNLNVGNEFTFGGGLAYEVKPQSVTLLAEAFGRAAADGDSVLEAETLPLEANLAARFTVAEQHLITLGAGPGLSAGYGTPTFRAFLGYTLTGKAPDLRDTDGDGIIDREDVCPKEAEDRDSFQDQDGCPDTDNDADGLLDAQDRCPNEAEDKDGFQDEDGCPDPDNDGDKVLDTSDKCPMDAEDRDKFQDDDGCPDPDNDGDGFLDAQDKCPNDPEDKDGLGDEDGCPEPDFDKDGVLDTTDQCPREPEVINGVKDDDGCPDKGESKVKMTDTRIEILDKVYFDTDKATIKRQSHNVLTQVAATLKAHPEITKLRVDGHTDNVADDAYNQKLSQERVESVRAFLIERGIDGNRLEAKGWGEAKPIANNATAEGRAANRRVEFTILEVDGKPVGENQPAQP